MPWTEPSGNLCGPNKPYEMFDDNVRLEAVEQAAAVGNLQLGELANNVAGGVDQFGMIALKPGIRILKARCTNQPVARAMISSDPQRSSTTW